MNTIRTYNKTPTNDFLHNFKQAMIKIYEHKINSNFLYNNKQFNNFSPDIYKYLKYSSGILYILGVAKILVDVDDRNISLHNLYKKGINCEIDTAFNSIINSSTYEKIRKFRNSNISHNTLNNIYSDKFPVKITEINSILTDIGNFYNLIIPKYLDKTSPILFDHTIVNNVSKDIYYQVLHLQYYKNNIVYTDEDRIKYHKDFKKYLDEIECERNKNFDNKQ